MPPTNTRKAKTLIRLKSLLATTSSTLSCGGCGSRRLKLPDVHHPLPKPSLHCDPSSSTSGSDDKLFNNADGDGVLNSAVDDAYSSDHPETDPQPSRDPAFDRRPDPDARQAPRHSNSRLAETFAVVKESDDPYLDFKHSMLQMIFEKEIFAKRDLQDLLACFLRLNAPCHHDSIIRAFSEIWKTVMSPAKENEPDSEVPAKWEGKVFDEIPQRR